MILVVLRFPAIILLAAACVGGCSKPSVVETTADVQEIADSFKLYRPFARAVQHASRAVLYEGLPHQNWERTTFTNELATKQTVFLCKHPFYSEPLSLSQEDTDTLRRLYCDSSSFNPFQGHKACGGYHPDYCLEWSNGTKQFLVQFCFGCHEMKTFSEGQEHYCEMSSTAFPKFESILKKYRGHRTKDAREL